MSLDLHKSHITDSRLSSYINIISDRNEKKAICFYTKILNISNNFYHVILEVEISLRNIINAYLEKNLDTTKFISIFDFYINNNGLRKYLTQTSIIQLNQAIEKSKKKSNSHNDIIANLSMGFWVSLFNTENENHKSIQTLLPLSIFNNTFNSYNHLFTELQNINRFRNRLYHQEPAWKNKRVRTPKQALINLEKKMNNFLILLKNISPSRYEMVSHIYTQPYLLDLFNYSKFDKDLKLIESQNYF